MVGESLSVLAQGPASWWNGASKTLEGSLVLLGTCSMADAFLTRLLGGSVEEPSMLSMFLRCLKLIHSLGAKRAQMLLEGQLHLSIDEDIFNEVSGNQILTMLRRYLAEAPLNKRVAMQMACQQAFLNTLDTPSDNGLSEAMAAFDPGTHPEASVQSLQRRINQVTEAWTTAFPHAMSPLQYQTARQSDAGQIMSNGTG